MRDDSRYSVSMRNTILGIGADLSSVARFRAIRYPERVASYYVHPQELRAMRTAADFPLALASRFAAKEAVIKASPVEIGPLDFEIVKRGKKPVVVWGSKNFPFSFLVSVSHESDHACAVALCLAT